MDGIDAEELFVYIIEARWNDILKQNRLHNWKMPPWTSSSITFIALCLVFNYNEEEKTTFKIVQKRMAFKTK